MYSNHLDTQQIPSTSTTSMDTSHGQTSRSSSGADTDTVMYDDVCIPNKTMCSSHNGQEMNNRTNGKPPLKKKPKAPLGKFRVYTTGHNDYENVTLQTLKSSLKQKFLPRKHHSLKSPCGSSNEKESSFIINKTCNCKECPVPLNRTASNEGNKHENGKCTICGQKDGVAELKVPTTSTDFTITPNYGTVENGHFEQSVI